VTVRFRGKIAQKSTGFPTNYNHYPVVSVGSYQADLGAGWLAGGLLAKTFSSANFRKPFAACFYFVNNL
jgi:hypothetical protein